MHADIWFDGASRGNPGPMAGGAIVLLDGQRTVLQGTVGRGSNNEAEYQGLILGLKHAANHGATTVHVRGDSQLILRQLEGQYQVKAANLKPYHQEAMQLLRKFEDVRLEWVRREHNGDADAAANAALDRV